MTDPRVVRDIIARLAQPEPIQDFSSVSPDKKELTLILLEILKGQRSPYHFDVTQAAERQHLDVVSLTRKAGLLLASLHLNSSHDYYSVLEVDQHAPVEAIHDQWLKKIRLYHPDMYEDPTGWIGQQARRLNEAYAVLKDPERRHAYDAARRGQTRARLQRTAGEHTIRLGRRADAFATRPSRRWLSLAAAIASIAIAAVIGGVLFWSW